MTPALRRPRTRGLFITGTDTGVGKTRVAAALAAWCARQALDVGVMKPIATGATRRAGALVSDDAEALIAAARVTDSRDLVNPVRYAEPLAPYSAARRAGAAVDLSRIARARAALRRRHRFVIVEGIGGLLVPLTRTVSVSDLAGRVGWPVLIVARSRLGTMNHTRLTVEQARRDGLDVLGVVLNGAEPARHADERLAERAAVADLPALLPVPVLGVLPYRSRAASPAALARWLARGVDPALLRWVARCASSTPRGR